MFVCSFVCVLFFYLSVSFFGFLCVSFPHYSMLMGVRITRDNVLPGGREQLPAGGLGRCKTPSGVQRRSTWKLTVFVP